MAHGEAEHDALESRAGQPDGLADGCLRSTPQGLPAVQGLAVLGDHRPDADGLYRHVELARAGPGEPLRGGIEIVQELLIGQLTFERPRRPAVGAGGELVGCELAVPRISAITIAQSSGWLIS